MLDLPLAAEQFCHRRLDHRLFGAVEVNADVAGVVRVSRPDAGDTTGAVHLRQDVTFWVHMDGGLLDVTLRNRTADGATVRCGRIRPDVITDRLAVAGDADLGAGGEGAVR